MNDDYKRKLDRFNRYMRDNKLLVLILDDGSCMITRPDGTAEVSRLVRAAGQLLANIADRLSQHPDACHGGCAFAALLDHARHHFNRINPTEYTRYSQDSGDETPVTEPARKPRTLH